MVLLLTDSFCNYLEFSSTYVLVYLYFFFFFIFPLIYSCLHLFNLCHFPYLSFSFYRLMVTVRTLSVLMPTACVARRYVESCVEAGWFSYFRKRTHTHSFAQWKTVICSKKTVYKYRVHSLFNIWLFFLQVLTQGSPHGSLQLLSSVFSLQRCHPTDSLDLRETGWLCALCRVHPRPYRVIVVSVAASSAVAGCGKKQGNQHL